jgi:hypothetical protein
MLLLTFPSTARNIYIYIYTLNLDIYCTRGAAVGLCANWPTMLPPSKSPAPLQKCQNGLPLRAGPPSRLANWRVHSVATPAPLSRRALFRPAGRRGLCPTRPPLQAPAQAHPVTCPRPGASHVAPRARLRLTRLIVCPPPRPPGRPTPPPRQLAPPVPLDLPGGLARPLSRARDAPPAAPAPRAWRTEDCHPQRVAEWAPVRRDILLRGSPCQGPNRRIHRRP